MIRAFISLTIAALPVALAAADWRPLAGRTRFFPRAQLKYRLDSRNYLHRWYERPLMSGSGEDPWLVTCRALRLGLMDGLAAVPTQRGREFVVADSERSDPKIRLLWELPYADFDRGVESYVEAAEKALASPASFRLDGKVVLTRYPGIDSSQLGAIAEAREILRQRHGDRFIVMAYSNFRGRTPAELKDEIRAFLRKTDGFLYCGYGQVKAKRYDSEYMDGFAIPLIHEVMDEPEFRGRKYLGLNLTGGHENCYQFDYAIDSTGTDYLRRSLDSVVRMRPDFVICCEWDEQNENTFFRPIVSSGFIVQRIFRYYVAKLAGRDPIRFPGDDTTIPNLALSYRKALVAGDPLEIEVLNIPDGTFAGRTFDVTLALKDMKGEVVKRFPSVRLRANDCTAAWFRDAASPFVGRQALLPELTVTCGGSSRTFSEGFWPLSLDAMRNPDCKWVRQALRDIAWGCEGSLSVRTEGGRCTVDASVRSPVELKSVEILDGPDTVHMAGCRERTWADAAVPVAIEAQGTSASSSRYEVRRYERKPSETLSFDFGSGVTGSVMVSDVVRAGAVGFAGTGGRAAVARLDYAPAALPDPCGGREARLSAPVDPLSPTGVFRLRIVDASNRIWCARAAANVRPSGKVRRIHVFERATEKVTELSLDAAFAPDVVYEPSPLTGAALVPEGFRMLRGVLGGGAALATGIGRGESCYGFPIHDAIKEDPSATAPKLVRDDGHWTMVFGPGRFGCLPRQVFPTSCGFEVEVEVCPEALSGKQALVMSAMSGFRLFLEDEVPVAVFALGNDVVNRHRRDTQVRGPELRSGEWNSVRVTFDQRTALVSVGGRKGTPVPLSGYEWNPGAVVIGATPEATEFYKGKMGRLRICPK